MPFVQTKGHLGHQGKLGTVFDKFKTNLSSQTKGHLVHQGKLATSVSINQTKQLRKNICSKIVGLSSLRCASSLVLDTYLKFSFAIEILEVPRFKLEACWRKAQNFWVIEFLLPPSLAFKGLLQFLTSVVIVSCRACKG